jgi:hypothetical protein
LLPNERDEPGCKKKDPCASGAGSELDQSDQLRFKEAEQDQACGEGETYQPERGEKARPSPLDVRRIQFGHLLCPLSLGLVLLD